MILAAGTRSLYVAGLIGIFDFRQRDLREALDIAMK